jgi:hypothetical protein
MKSTLTCLLLFLVVSCGGGLPGPHPSPVPLVHRPSAPTCPSDRPTYNCGEHVTGPPVSCHLDSDCVSGSNGRCVGNGHDGCSCSYDTCTSDAGCPSGTLCDCRDQWHYGTNGPNQCLPSNCRVDADCGPGGYCSPTFSDCGAYSGVTGWFCHTAADTCTNDSDCSGVDGGLFGTPYCAYRPEVGHWACSTSQCAG